MIKEVIIVEGKDDICAVKKAVEAEVIAVNGYGINKAAMDKIMEAEKRTGVIILTDPDFAGERIRRMIGKRVPFAKHAYIMREDGNKGGNIGVENASPDVIRRALALAKAVEEEKVILFTQKDLLDHKLSGHSDSKRRRQVIGAYLGIGYGNSASFLSKLNSFKVTREEFLQALQETNQEDSHDKY